MLWIFSALGSSFTDAFQNIFIKKQTQSLGALTVSWVRSFWIAIILLPLIFIFPSQPSQLFWWIIIIRTILDTLATVLYVKSFKHSDISLVLPIIALTPLFIVFMEILVFGRIPRILGFIGICFVVCGTYLLNIRNNEKGLLAPFTNLYRNSASRMMLAVAIIWSITSMLHTVAIRETNAYFYGGMSALLIILALTCVSFLRGELKPNKNFVGTFSGNATPGVLGASSLIFQFIAQSLAPTSYVIAIKRTSIVFSSVLASIFFKERIEGRLFPATLSTIGVILIALSYI